MVALDPRRSYFVPWSLFTVELQKKYTWSKNVYLFFCYRRNQYPGKRVQEDQCLVQRLAQESDAGALDVGSVKIANERTVASAEPVKI